MSHNFAKLFEEEFLRETEKAHIKIMEKVVAKEQLFQAEIREFVENSVKPNLRSQSESLDAETEEGLEEFNFVSALMAKLSDYADHIRLQLSGEKVTIEVDDDYKDTYYNLEYGTPYTDTFEHMNKMVEFIQKLAYEVNKIEGITGFPVQLGKSSL
jgi:hypothetical protein